jgi:uncharacterized protein (TIGR03083 family)
MDHDAYLTSLREAGHALAAAADGNLGAQVPSCPEWKVADLVAHTGRVHAWVTGIVDAGGAPPGPAPEAPSDPAELVPWYRDVHAQLLGRLAAHSPDDPAWVFVPTAPQQVGWWYRRQALETAIHRYDAQSAVGRATPIDAELAVAGVDEFLTEFLPGVMVNRPVAGLTGTFHVHATDTPGEWWLDFGAKDLAARRDHAKADAALRGPAAGLFLWVWNRTTVKEAGLEAFGDGSVIEAWRDVKF